MTGNVLHRQLSRALLLVGVVYTVWFAGVMMAEAATLSVLPGTGVYASGGTFTARVMVNPSGKSINAAEGTLKFNPQELSVVSVNRTGSIFNLWVAEPSFSNSAGTISFSGGSPSGYDGGVGTIMNVTFRTVGSGSARVTFSNGSVLANDGRGTNVLTSMSGGTYTVQSQNTSPDPEVVVEYVPPANTPGRPNITSSTHADQDAWHTRKNASLSWNLPAGITAVRTLLDQNQYTIPTKVYDNPIDSIELSDLAEGINYFHLQFQNEDGWGTVAHYRLAVDSERPSVLEITQSEPDFTNPVQTLTVSTTDSVSGVTSFLVRVDGAEPFEVEAAGATTSIELPELAPGYHTVTVDARDAAGNNIIDNYSFTIEAFERPEFTVVPDEVPADVIPVFKGTSRPRSTITVALEKLGADTKSYEVVADDAGNFSIIPEGTLDTGVYELTATAVDEFGAQSEVSAPVRFAVQEPGYMRVGSFVVSVLSVVVPTLALIVLLILLLLYGWRKITVLRQGVTKESGEALAMLETEFATLKRVLAEHSEEIATSRKSGKLTKAEDGMVTALDDAITHAERNVRKEITDVQDLTDNE